MSDFEEELRAQADEVRQTRSRERQVIDEVMAKLPEHRAVWRSQAASFARVAAEIGMVPWSISGKRTVKKRLGRLATETCRVDVLFSAGGVAITVEGELVEVGHDWPSRFPRFLEDDEFGTQLMSELLYRDYPAARQARPEEMVGIRRDSVVCVCCVTPAGELVVVDGYDSEYTTFEHRLKDRIRTASR
ncbi:hypothetical protein [Amycolatopsis sp. NPDC059021]|uniref:hypothetical protein n=2 Tax=unclassified Amycolatopsis TaxID=2618356 RepID=UPI00366D28D0